MGDSSTPYLSRFLGLLAFTLFPLDAFAQPTCTTTLEPGNYFSQTWNAAGSPYCVTGDITVGHLTVDPGVQVFVDGPYAINVFTHIVANGTAELPILFSAKLPEEPNNERWKGFKFVDAPSGSSFTHTTIEYSSESAISITTSPAPVLANCLIRNNATTGNGGGISGATVSSNLSITNCKFLNNQATNGGAIFVADLTGALFISGSEFRDNSSSLTAGGVHVTLNGPGTTNLIQTSIFKFNTTKAHAGALGLIMNNGAVANITSSAFFGNGSDGTASTSVAGALRLESGSANIQSSYFAGNEARAHCESSCSIADAQGGAIHAASTTLSIKDSIITGNRVDATMLLGGVGRAHGGGLKSSGTLDISHTLVACNQVSAIGQPTTEIRGAGIYTDYYSSVSNLTVARNLGAAGIALISYPLTIANSIVFENGGTGNGIDQGFTSVNASYSDIQTAGPDPLPGTGNIRTAPGFLGAGCGANEFVTFSISPSVDGGNPDSSQDDACLPPGQVATRNDMGAFGGPGNCTPLPEAGRDSLLAAGVLSVLALAGWRRGRA